MAKLSSNDISGLLSNFKGRDSGGASASSSQSSSSAQSTMHSSTHAKSSSGTTHSVGQTAAVEEKHSETVEVKGNTTTRNTVTSRNDGSVTNRVEKSVREGNTVNSEVRSSTRDRESNVVNTTTRSTTDLRTGTSRSEGVTETFDRDGKTVGGTSYSSGGGTAISGTSKANSQSVSAGASVGASAGAAGSAGLRGSTDTSTGSSESNKASVSHAASAGAAMGAAGSSGITRGGAKRLPEETSLMTDRRQVDAVQAGATASTSSTSADSRSESTAKSTSASGKAQPNETKGNSLGTAVGAGVLSAAGAAVGAAGSAAAWAASSSRESVQYEALQSTEGASRQESLSVGASFGEGMSGATSQSNLLGEASALEGFGMSHTKEGAATLGGATSLSDFSDSISRDSGWASTSTTTLGDTVSMSKGHSGQAQDFADRHSSDAGASIKESTADTLGESRINPVEGRDIGGGSLSKEGGSVHLEQRAADTGGATISKDGSSVHLEQPVQELGGASVAKDGSSIIDSLAKDLIAGGSEGLREPTSTLSSAVKEHLEVHGFVDSLSPSSRLEAIAIASEIESRIADVKQNGGNLAEATHDISGGRASDQAVSLQTLDFIVQNGLPDAGHRALFEGLGMDAAGLSRVELLDKVGPEAVAAMEKTGFPAEKVQLAQDLVAGLGEAAAENGGQKIELNKLEALQFVKEVNEASPNDIAFVTTNHDNTQTLGIMSKDEFSETAGMAGANIGELKDAFKDLELGKNRQPEMESSAPEMSMAMSQ